MYPTNVINDKVGASPAKADTHSNFQIALGVSTMEIPLTSGGFGIATRIGTVRGIDTSAFPVGDTLWLSPLSAGLVTNEKPSFPDYALQMGAVLISDATSGAMELEILGNETETFRNFYNGIFRETINFTVSGDGSAVSGFLVMDILI